MKASPWQSDAVRLQALITQGWGTLLWEREADGRWYLVCVTRSLFEETLLELRWGGAQRPPSRIQRMLITEQNRHTVAHTLCRRRHQHGYILQ